MNFISEFFAHLSRMFKTEEAVIIQDRPSKKATNQLLNYLPDELALNGPNVNVKGPYKTKTGRCIGAIIHGTGGSNRIGRAVEELKETPYGFLCIDYDGTCYQPRNYPLNRWAEGSGISSWVIDGVKVDRVSSKFLQIEICTGGVLEKKQGVWRTWFGKVVPPKYRRTVKAEDNRMAGTYEIFSQAQEEKLINILVWLCKNDPEFRPDLILGHDEVSGPKGIGYHRKSDPGGSLSMTMSELRKQVKARL